MTDTYDVVRNLTSGEGVPDRLQIRQFSHLLGWHPSDYINVPQTATIANGHLVVEHGLENSAVLSFLRNDRRYSDCTFDEQRALLSISYNNLVDWHLAITRDELVFLYNRTDPATVVHRAPVSRVSVDALRSAYFDQIVGRKPNPNLPALDTALIQTLSYWKRELSASSEYLATNESISTLFNFLIFLRAAEDQQTVYPTDSPTPSLRKAWALRGDQEIRTVLDALIRSYNHGQVPTFLENGAHLSVFQQLDGNLVTDLIEDFYSNRFARPYDYNFSLISKHALSRIYEHYVSLLRLEPDDQAALFPRLPEEERNKSYGSFYTPQYVARFFARFIREVTPPNLFRRIRSIDPACGSGVFLRTLLELQCDPLQDGVTNETVDDALSTAFGLDVDPNACQATRLSLSLLYLVLRGKLPDDLPILNQESLGFFLDTPQFFGTFDAVIVNPPFVRHELLEDEMRVRIDQVLGALGHGRSDLYLPFIKLSIDLLKPGGLACLVLPQSFLVAANGSALRKYIRQNCWVRCIADLSSIRVFDQAQSYVSLLILQRKKGGDAPPHATMVKCTDGVGQALHDALLSKEIETGNYSVYAVDQATFDKDKWRVLTAKEARLSRILDDLPTIGEFLDIRQGFVTGADSVFLRPAREVPREEGSLFIPYLQDRSITRYVLPKASEMVMFYPYQSGRKVSSEQLQSEFPETWKYLLDHRDILSKRASLGRYSKEWWEPMWARPPEHMLQPKIVTPHVAIMPRFGLDAQGKYAISRSPMLFAKDGELAKEHLLFFLAVLNNPVAFWHIHSESSKLKGYARLEALSIRTVPVPDPSTLEIVLLSAIIGAVEERMSATRIQDIARLESEIESLVFEAYRLSDADRSLFGVR